MKLDLIPIEEEIPLTEVAKQKLDLQPITSISPKVTPEVDNFLKSPKKTQIAPKKTILDLQPTSKQVLDLSPVEKTTLNLQPIKEQAQKISPKSPRKEKVSLFSNIIDILGRPGQAIKSYLLSGQERTKNIYRELGYKVDTLEDVDKLPAEAHKRFGEEANKIGLKQEFKESLETLWKGFSGQEKSTMNEQLKEVGIEGIPFLGFASELAVDPLMWFGGAGYKAITKGIGTVAKPTLKVSAKAIGAGIKGLEKIPKVGKVVTTAKETLPTLAEGLKKAFVTKSGLKGLTELIDKHLLKREYLRAKELKYGVKVRNVIQNISKKTGQSIDDVEKQVVNLIEQPQLVSPETPSEIRVLSNTLRTHFENLLTSEMKAGVPITHLSEGTRGIQYFPRITTKEAKQYLKQARIGNKKVWNPKLANALSRKTGEFTLGEFNDFVKTHGLESLGGKQVEQFFMRSPAYATATRGIRSAKAVTSAEFLDDVGKTFGMTADDAVKQGKSFYQELPDTITKLNPSLKGKVFDPEVYSEITKVTPKYFNPNELEPITKIFDAIQNTWKRWTLAPFPKYHLRNMIGNKWNNYLADVDPGSYAKAQAIQTYRKYKSATKGVKGKLRNLAIKELDSFGMSTQQADDIIRQAEQTGVLGHGWFGGDIETTIEKTMQQGFINQPLNIKIKKVLTGEIGVEKGMAFGSTIENNARLAHFVDKLNKGDDVMVAAQSVKKYLFDYGDLTHFEKQIMKRLFPFYTWTRKNIPLQLEQLWKQPQKYAPLGIPLRAREPKDLVRLKYARPDLYERLPMELRRDADTVTYVPMEGLLPAGDLAKIIRPDELLFEMITPYLKAPLELKFNKSLFFESEVQRYDRETQELLKTDLPIKMKYLATTVLPQARLLNELNKLVKKQTRKEKLTPLEQTFSQSLSSIYKVNLKDLELRAKQNIKRKVDDLVQGAKWAKRKGREREYQRIKETIRETMKLIKELR